MDPRLPKEVLLPQTRFGRHATGVDIEYPGETAPLALTIALALVLAGSLALISFGLAAIFIFVSFLQLQFSERRLRDGAMLRVTHWTVPEDSSQGEQQVVADGVFDLSEILERHPALELRLRQIGHIASVAGQRGQL